MTKLHLLKVAARRWKQVQDTREEFRNIACKCRHDVRKVKAQLQLRLARDIKGNKKSSYCCISAKRPDKEKVGSVLSKVGDLVAEDTDKTEMLIAFFASVFTNEFSQPTVLSERVQREEQPAVTLAAKKANSILDCMNWGRARD